MDRIRKKAQRMWGLFVSDIRSLAPAIIIIAVYYCLSITIFGHFCPSRILFNITCPGCGLTRGSLCLLTGRFERAFYYNPSVFLWDPYIIYLLFFRYVKEKEAPLRLPLFFTLMGISVILWLIRLPNLTI